MELPGFLLEFTALGWNFSDLEGVEWNSHELYGFVWNVIGALFVYCGSDEWTPRILLMPSRILR